MKLTRKRLMKELQVIMLAEFHARLAAYFHQKWQLQLFAYVAGLIAGFYIGRNQ